MRHECHCGCVPPHDDPGHCAANRAATGDYLRSVNEGGFRAAELMLEKSRLVREAVIAAGAASLDGIPLRVTIGSQGGTRSAPLILAITVGDRGTSALDADYFLEPHEPGYERFAAVATQAGADRP